MRDTRFKKRKPLGGLIPTLMLALCYASPDAEMLGGWYDGDLRQFMATNLEASINPIQTPINHNGNPYKTSRWQGSGTEDSWVTVDLAWPDTHGQLKLYLSRVCIIWDNTLLRDFSIEVQTTQGSSWKNVYAGKTDTAVNNLEVYHFAAAEAKRVRIFIPGGGHPRIRYMQFYGEITGETVPFVQPGIITTRADVTRIRDLVKNGTQPNLTAWKALQAMTIAKPSVKPRPEAHITWSAVQTHQEQVRFSSDGERAYFQAIQWMMTGDTAYAKNVLSFMSAWARTLTTVSGDNSLSAFGAILNFSQAASLVKYSYPKWDAAVEKSFLDMLDRFVVPHMEARNYGNNNWTAQHNKAIMALAIWRNDRYQFNRAVQRMKNIINALDTNGYGHELTTRDWNHGMMHQASIAEGAEVAWNQGVDLYAYRNFHIARSYENLAWIDLEGGAGGTYPDPGGPVVWQGSSKPKGPGASLPAFSWENVYNHYVNRIKKPMPKLMARQKTLHQSASVDGYTHHYGWGSLLKANVGDTRATSPILLRAPSESRPLASWGDQPAGSLRDALGRSLSRPGELHARSLGIPGRHPGIGTYRIGIIVSE